MLLKVKFLRHEIGNNTIKPIPSKIEAIKRIPSPKEEKDVMQFLGSVNVYSKCWNVVYKSQTTIYFTAWWCQISMDTRLRKKISRC